jgi:hypothetical protein
VPPQPGFPPGAQPGAPFGIEPTSGLPYSDKSKVVAGLLQIFLGYLGAGRFYTGHIAIAVLQLCFAWATCGIWPIVDGIMMLTGKVRDSEGRPLRE